ncbi:ANTAR domain-containing protein [Streptomyces sp. NPDC102406]|uniref:ANTAR domain-containing protein n=1 Tax=Streptomyces sp. NPDC102406 TaxID=3366171 RepID=UPI00381BE33D
MPGPTRTSPSTAVRGAVDNTLNATVRQSYRREAEEAYVDQAIGVLVATAPIPPATAFTVLREVSQRTNTELRARSPCSPPAAHAHAPAPAPAPAPALAQAAAPPTPHPKRPDTPSDSRVRTSARVPLLHAECIPANPPACVVFMTPPRQDATRSHLCACVVRRGIHDVEDSSRPIGKNTGT